MPEKGGGEEGFAQDLLSAIESEVRGSRKRVKTFVNGFDEVLEGGIPKGHVVLIAGSAGTMKSSLAYSILYRNALEEGSKGLYLSLEQNRQSLEDHMYGLGLNLQKVAGKVEIWDLGLLRSKLISGETWLNLLKKDIADHKARNGLDLVALDSLPALDIIAKYKDPREELFYFFEWLRELGVTSLLISEMVEGVLKYSKNDEDFLADGIIHLKMQFVDDVHVQRRIRAVKMRNTKHSLDFYTLLFENGRFSITKVIGKVQE
ncbi:MAG: ATPase domain-containing protein [Thermoplasmata archaeon]